MTTTKKVFKAHDSKLWEYFYPLYARVILLDTYEQFAQEVQKDWTLTPEQWGILLSEYEFIHQYMIGD